MKLGSCDHLIDSCLAKTISKSAKRRRNMILKTNTIEDLEENKKHIIEELENCDRQLKLVNLKI